jgi:phosphatidylglycerophosphatase C
MAMTVAAFDWDGTLTRRDCVVPFLVDVAGTSSLCRRLGATPGSLVGAVVRRDRDRLKALGVAAAFTDRSVDDVAERGRRFAQRVLDGWLRPDTMARLRWHQAVGHRVIIVSASLAPYLEPLGRQLGVDAVLCTRVAHVDGRYTGDLEGPNCRGVHKVERLDQWRREHPDDMLLEWAYGDSRGDDALLAAAQRGVKVGRTRLEAVPRPSEMLT